MTVLSAHLVGLRPTDWQEVLSAVEIDADLVRPKDFLLEMLTVAGDVGRCERKSDAEGRNAALVHLGLLIFVGATKSTVFLSTGMALKFPGRCTGCDEAGPCDCGESYPRKAVPMPDEPDPKHVRMSVLEWQKDMRMRFYAKNIARGFEATLGRLNEEIGETVKAQRNVEKAQWLAQTVDRALTRALFCEYADILAWWMAVVNLCGLQVEDLLHQALINERDS